jgi:hypothetical protein
VLPVWVENGSVGVFPVVGIAKMAASVTGGSTRKRESDFPLRSEVVGCRLSVGPEVQSGNSGITA